MVTEQTVPKTPGKEEKPKGRIKQFLEKHGRKLWWLHSVWALTWGILFMILAGKGYGYARFLLMSVCILWVVVVFFFRFVGSGTGQKMETKGEKVRFYAMTYVLKNLYQSMLFFLLPYYWKSATPGTQNFYFVIFLAVCAMLSTLDIVFDNYLMKWKSVASAFYIFTLFACLNVAIPSVLPGMRSLWTYLLAGFVAMVAFLAMHFPAGLLKDRRYLGVLGVILALWLSFLYVGRRMIPPVPLYLSHVAVGPKLTQADGAPVSSGQLAMEVTSLHYSRFSEDLYVITEVVAPGGLGDNIRHLWRHKDEDYEPKQVQTISKKDGLVRIESRVPMAKFPKPAQRVGRWTIDVLTEDGRLVGRSHFTVTGDPDG
jgi:hypothetical protein